MQRELLAASSALVLALALRLLRAWRNRRAWYAIGFAITSMSYLIAWATHELPLARSVKVLLMTLLVAQPVFFWLTASALFDDSFVLRWWHGVWIAGKFLVAYGLFAGQPIPDMFIHLTNPELPRLLPNAFYSLSFVFMGFAAILRTQKQDLSEPRRQIRRLVLVVAGILILQAMLSTLVLRPMGYGNLADQIALFSITLSALAATAWGDAAWQDIFLTKRAATKNAVDEQDVLKAIAAMEEQELFRTEGLTVSVLAEKLGLKDYRLRSAINQGLGYRNFNEYLNFYRIRAAKKFLSDETNAHYPIIHLALDLGYPSPAPFNRAFKEATGLTPVEYRRIALQREQQAAG